jgi:uncharacterized protein (TIGR00251 family)
MTINIQVHAEGLVFRIRAQARARADQLRGEQDHALKVAVVQAAEKGKANKAIIKLLATKLGLRRSQLEIIAGHTSPQKLVLVREIGVAELAERLNQIG